MKKAFLYIILAGIFWGTSGIFVHYLAPYGFSSLQMTFVRGAVSFIGMLLYVLICRRRALRVRALDLLCCVFIGITLFLTGSCYFTSMQMTSVSTAVVLMYSAPVYVSIFSALFFGEQFSRLKWCAVGCMLVGCCLVSGVIGGLRFDLVGILIGMLSGISYAAYNVLTKISMRRGNDPITTTLYSFLFMVIVAALFAQPGQLPSLVAPSPLLLIPLLIGMGVVTYVAPYFLYTLGIRDLPAGTASALGIVEPMAATVFSVFLLQEPISWISAIGILLIVGSVFMLAKAEDNKGENS